MSAERQHVPLVTGDKGIGLARFSQRQQVVALTPRFEGFVLPAEVTID